MLSGALINYPLKQEQKMINGLSKHFSIYQPDKLAPVTRNNGIEHTSTFNNTYKGLKQTSAKHYAANIVPFLGTYKIIDAHGHINRLSRSGEEYRKYRGKDGLTPEIIKNAVNVTNPPGQDEIIVTHVAISNLAGLNNKDYIPGEPTTINPKEASILAYEVCQASQVDKKPEFIALLNCDPNPREDHYGSLSKRIKDLEELINDPGKKFYGMKFHPYHNNVDGTSKAYDPFMKLASKYDLPCFFHCAPDDKSDPLKTIELAKRFKNVPVVMYHINLGADMYHFDRAVEKAKEAIEKSGANIYLELSWVNNLDRVMKAIRDVGPDRVIFGTDTSLGEMADPVEYRQRVVSIINKIRENYDEAKAEEIIQKVFYDNSKKLFKLEK